MSTNMMLLFLGIIGSVVFAIRTDSLESEGLKKLNELKALVATQREAVEGPNKRKITEVLGAKEVDTHIGKLISKIEDPQLRRKVTSALRPYVARSRDLTPKELNRFKDNLRERISALKAEVFLPEKIQFQIETIFSRIRLSERIIILHAKSTSSKEALTEIDRKLMGITEKNINTEASTTFYLTAFWALLFTCSMFLDKKGYRKSPINHDSDSLFPDMFKDKTSHKLKSGNFNLALEKTYHNFEKLINDDRRIVELKVNSVKSECFVEEIKLERIFYGFMHSCHHLLETHSDVASMIIQAGETDNNYTISCFLPLFTMEAFNSPVQARECLKGFSLLEAQYASLKAAVDFKVREGEGLEVILQFENLSELEFITSGRSANA